MKKHIPNLITSLNVTSGTIAIYAIFNDNLLLASYLILLAMVFDFFDGFVARLLNVKSDIGRELDSLADMVSFSVAPAFLAFKMIDASLYFVEVGDFYFLRYVPFVIPAFSAYRLAKFNLDTRQTHSFIGMPTPANALFWVTLVMTFEYKPEFYNTVWNSPVILAILAVVFSVLLISEIPMFSLKLKGFAYRLNKTLYVYLGIIVLLSIIWGIKAVSFFIPIYALMSIIEYVCKRIYGQRF